MFTVRREALLREALSFQFASSEVRLLFLSASFIGAWFALDTVGWTAG